MFNVAGSATFNSKTGTWPGGGGHNPGNLGQDLRNTNFSSVVTKKLHLEMRPQKTVHVIR